MANRKEKLELGTFGDAPSFTASLPSAKLDNDIAVAAAIGSIGGGVKRLWCSTLFYFGSLAKKKGETYNPGKAWEAYYAKMYAAAPMQPGSKKTAKKEDIKWAAFAQVKKWDTQELAGYIFDYEHGSFSQKAATVQKVIDNHKDAAPTEEELAKLMPKPKPKGGDPAETTIKAWANGKKKAFDDISAELMAQVEGSAELTKRFNTAKDAVTLFAAMAATITDKKKKDEKSTADAALANAALKKALKATKEKGATTH